MKQLKLVVIALVLSISETNAQSYLSPEPVDAGSNEVSEFLLGNWREQKNMDAGQTFQVFKNPNVTGHINIVPGIGAMIPAILSTAGPYTYLSVYEAGGKERPEGYYIFRLEQKSNAEIRLVPLRQDLKKPEGETLKHFLANADTKDIDAEHALWFSHTFYQKKEPLDMTGREINITKKER
ncbi:MAG: hypothetical protein H6551_12910 [Chitinophagales bacterium]|nr:hypothetical protein [Chitinophagaceae bacterium]MCB9066032.1 hypothetical protein [Chitinophagales bacterium]